MLQISLAIACLCTAAALALFPAFALGSVRTVHNPLFSVGADPDVVRIEHEGQTLFLLTHTVGNGEDFPLYVSSNLVDWKLQGHLLGVETNTHGDSIQMGSYHYCSNWAPEIRPSVKQGGFILSFTSSRYEEPQRPCGAYDEGSGTFVAWSQSPFGPFNTADSHPQPTGASTDTRICPTHIHDELPFTHVKDTNDCGAFLCNNTQRLDSDLFNDPQSDESWFAYSWYSNSEPITPFDHDQLGEHASLVRVNHSDPMLVPCDPQQATKVWVQSPHDQDTLDALAAYCERCGEQLSFTKGRMNETMMRDGVVWGVVEASMLFRRGAYVYQLMSHSAWDSAYYSVMFAAAPSAAELGMGSPTRIVGRFLIPSRDQSFGHGSAVLGPDGVHFYYVHHHLDHKTCNSPSADCSRDIYISPLEFEDRGDGLGDVWIKPVFPAENLTVDIYEAGAAEEQDGTGQTAPTIATE